MQIWTYQSEDVADKDEKFGITLVYLLHCWQRSALLSPKAKTIAIILSVWGNHRHAPFLSQFLLNLKLRSIWRSTLNMGRKLRILFYWESFYCSQRVLPMKYPSYFIGKTLSLPHPNLATEERAFGPIFSLWPLLGPHYYLLYHHHAVVCSNTIFLSYL